MGGRGAASGIKRAQIASGHGESESEHVAEYDHTQIANRMKQKYGIRVDTESLKTVSPEALKAACDGIDLVLDEFPAAASFFTALSGGGVFGNDAAGTYPTGEITLNLEIYHTLQSLDAAWGGDAKTHYHPPGTGKHATAHEAGHLIIGALIDREVEKRKQQAIAAGEKIASSEIRWAFVSDWNNNKTARRVVETALKRLGSNSTEHDLKRAVSIYALKDDGECVSECVADYAANRGNAQPLSKAVWAVLKDELR